MIDRVCGRGFGTEEFGRDLSDCAGAGPPLPRQRRQLDPTIPPIVELEGRIQHLRVAGRFTPTAKHVDIAWRTV